MLRILFLPYEHGTDKTMAKSVAGISNCRGVTLLEILIVVSIISVMAAAVIPMVNSSQTFVLENTVSQVKYALQFAREHARATGNMVIVKFDNAAGIIKVNRIDSSLTEFPIMHPLTKKDYIVNLNSQPLTGTRIQLQTEFTFADTWKSLDVTFNDNGAAGRHSLLWNGFVPIKEPGAWRGFWRIAEGYSAGDWVEHNKALYDCLTNHTAGSSFASDLASGRWKVRTQPGQVRISAGAHKQQIHVEPSWGFIRVAPR